ncbi:MAG TPA: 4Fe-4S binding protein [Armatimonadota bacterium]|nr:4Fe-4S binding protein [Armatimonadota bacterium]
MRIATLAPLLLMVLAPPCMASEEFPPPEFSQGYHYPHVSTPAPRAEWFGYVDVAVLLVVLSVAAYVVLKKRARREVVILSVFSLLYFGFYRHGCICAIGAIQNVAYAALGADYGLPVVAAAFFLIPLLFVLLFGRVFCGAACPLGAAQEVVLLRPVKVPAWLDSALGTVPYVYLGGAVLFAGTGSAFVICDYDPFVLFFRLSGSAGMLIFGAVVLLLSTVVGRPYCRYLCPYGVLLRLLAPFSKWQVRITPTDCINCHLCAEACPYGAIQAPTPDPGSVDRHAGRGKLALLVVLLPVLMVVGGALARLTSPLLARVHPRVQLANRLWAEEQGRVEEMTDETEAFEEQGLPTSDVYREAAAIHGRFHVGSWAFGGWIGLVLGMKMIGLSVRRHRREYEVDPGSCLACSRCYASCPVEHAGADALPPASMDEHL